MYKLPKRRGGGEGGEVIWAMPERKHSFSNEVFPNSPQLNNNLKIPTHYLFKYKSNRGTAWTLSTHFSLCKLLKVDARQQ